MSKAELVLAVLGIVFGGQGIWQFVVGPWIEEKRKKKKQTSQDKALVGLLYEKIYDICDETKKQWKQTGKGISRARYEHIVHNLLIPYQELGGNSDAEQRVLSLQEFIDER